MLLYSNLFVEVELTCLGKMLCVSPQDIEILGLCPAESVLSHGEKVSL